MIHYTLHENHLTSDANDYAAQVRITESANPDAIVARIVERGTTVDAATVRSVILELVEVCGAMLLEGKRINLGDLCDLYPRIIGKFQGPSDHFDPARHRVDVGASPGAGVREIVREKAKTTKEEASRPAPLPIEYVDLASGESNGALTPGDIGAIKGNRLKFDPDKKDEGIFLLSGKADGKAIRIARVQKNKPGELIFLVPADLPKGGYRLEVRARMTRGSELREGRLDAVLTA